MARRIRSTEKQPRVYGPGDFSSERSSRLGAVRTKARAAEPVAADVEVESSVAETALQATGSGSSGGLPLLSPPANTTAEYVLAVRDLGLPLSRVLTESDTIKPVLRDPKRVTLEVKTGTVPIAALEDVTQYTLLGNDTAGTAPVTAIQVESIGIDFLQQANAADQRTALGLGTAAVLNSGDFEASGTVAAHAALLDAHGNLKLFKILSAAANVTDGTSAQDWFPTNGDVTVTVNRAYLFEGTLRLSKGTGVATDVLVGFAGTATYTVDWEQIGQGLTFDTAGNVQVSSGRTTTAQLAATPSSTAANAWITVRGVLRVTGAGTFIPQFQFTAAPGGTPQALRGTRFALTEIGADTVTERGTWS